MREASPVLQNRRERLEELTLEAQEVRAKRELAKLQREDQEEAEQQEEEEEAREQEATERQAELEQEREQLEQAQAQERARKEAERALAAFRCQWLQEAHQALAAPQCYWLSAAQKKEIIDAVETEIGKRQPIDATRMATILAHTIAALMERFQAERQAQKRRQEIIDRAAWSVSVFATDQEKVRATVAVREAVSRLDADSSEGELLTSAQEAVRPIQQAIERRRLKERVLNWAIQQLPWNKTELDAVRVRRECGEILAELPEDFSEVEAKEALAATVQEACQDIEERLVSQQRQDRKKRLIEQGITEISTYLYELERQGEITSDERLDSDFSQHIRTAVRRELETELSGDESNKEVRELVREFIDSELG